MGLIIHVDGGSRGNPGPSGAGVVIRSEDGRLIHEGGYFLGRQTNNAAEYHATIRALQRAMQCEAQPLCVYSDSQLLVRQMTGEYEVKNPKLAQLHSQVQMLLLRVKNWSFRHIDRAENQRADLLANLAMDQRRDVILFDAEAPTPDHQRQDGEVAPTPWSASGRLPSLTEETQAVRVVLARSPRGGPCPAGVEPPRDFTVTGVLPPGLCLHAAHALLPTLLAMLGTEPEEFAAVPTLTVPCGRSGCGAVFHLTPVRSSNGGRRREEP